MMNLKRGISTNRFAAPVASMALALAGVIACSTDTGTAPDRLMAPKALFDLTGNASAGSLEVCKNGTDASFTVTFGGNFNAGNIAGGITPAGGNSYTFSLTAGQCLIVYERPIVGGVTLDPEVTATVVESAPINGNTFVSVSVEAESTTPTSTDQAARSGTVALNMFHDARVTFVNAPPPPSEGCTFTQGWYKNHASSWPSGALTPSTSFDGGATLLTILNTPPKGSQYIILAHQYITALLNIQGGASVPSDVQDALDTAEAYFAGGGAGAGDSSVDISGVATILDNYNNGLVGPGHCDD